jgi:uncharacterized protein YjbI with pentapeptide repeats
MPWIEPTDAFAMEPRLPRRSSPRESWDGKYDGDDVVNSIEAVHIGAVTVAASGGLLELLDVEATGATFETGDGGALDLIDSVFTDCDFSRTTITLIRGCRFIGCKFAGTDLSERTTRDSVFERCNLQYTNLRMSTLQRLQFVESRLDDVDFSESQVEDVSFHGSDLSAVNTERCRFERADLRSTTKLDLSSPSNLHGCLIDDSQVLELSYRLALLAGASIEREED